MPWGVVTRYDAIAVVQFGPFERRREDAPEPPAPASLA